MANSSDEDVPLTESGGKEGGPGPQISKDISSVTSWINPDFSGKTEDRVSKLDANHFYGFLFFFGATIAFSVSTGMISSLGAARAFTLEIGVITPPVNGTGDAYQDAFTVQNHELSPLPITVLICVIAGVYMAYHFLHGLLYRDWTRAYIQQRVNTARWVTMAITRSLEMIVLFTLNGERQLTAILLIVAATIGVCCAANGFDMVVKNCYTQCKPKSKDTMAPKYQPLSYWREVVNLGQILILMTAVIAAAFLIRICYNRRATPTWVLGLSIAFLIMHSLSVLYYVWCTWNTTCRCKQQEYEFVRADWKINMYNLVLFIVLSVVVFAEQAKM